MTNKKEITENQALEYDSFEIIPNQFIDVITWNEQGEEVKGKMRLEDLLEPLEEALLQEKGNQN